MSIKVKDKTYSSEDVKNAITNGNKQYGSINNVTKNADSSLTQAEMDEIIKYATSKNIKIIPGLNSPGHMDSILYAMANLGIENPNFINASKKSITTLDLTNEKAVEFTKEFIQLYLNYFSQKGIEYFNMGADEYANDIGSGFKYLINQNKFEKFVDYTNEISRRIKNKGMRPLAFNDAFYYKGAEDAKFDTDIILALWSAGYWGYDVAKADVLVSKGHQILNFNEHWYYVLGRENSEVYNRQKALSNMGKIKFDNTNGRQVDFIGSVIAFWCDQPAKEYEPSKLFDWIETFAKNNPDHFKPIENEEPIEPEKPGEADKKLEEELAKTKEKLDKKEKELSGKEKEFDETKKTLKDLKEKLDSEKTYKKELEQEKAKLEAKVAELTKKLDEIKVKNQEDEKKLLDANKKIEELYKKIEDLNKQIQDKEKVETDKKTAEEKLVQQEKELNKLKEEKVKLENEIKKLKEEKAEADKKAPEIVGKDFKYDSEKDSELLIKSNGLFESFKGLEIDGKEVAKQNYTAEKGSTIVKINKAFLDTLSKGKHAFAMIFGDSEEFKAARLSGTFEVIAKEETEKPVGPSKQGKDQPGNSDEHRPGKPGKTDKAAEPKDKGNIDKTIISPNNGTNTNNKVTSPLTGDRGILPIIMILLVSLLAFVGIKLVKSKK